VRTPQVFSIVTIHPGYRDELYRSGAKLSASGDPASPILKGYWRSHGRVCDHSDTAVVFFGESALIAQQKEQRGFTLLELMVVIAVMGIMSAIAAPAYIQATQTQRSMGERDKVIEAIKEARDRARLRICRTALSFNPAAGTITVQTATDETDTNCPTDVETFEVDTDLITFTALGIAGAPVDPFLFVRDGTPAYITRASMTITNVVTGGVQTVEVWPGIGAVEVTQ